MLSSYQKHVCDLRDCWRFRNRKEIRWDYVLSLQLLMCLALELCCFIWQHPLEGTKKIRRCLCAPRRLSWVLHFWITKLSIFWSRVNSGLSSPPWKMYNFLWCAQIRSDGELSNTVLMPVWSNRQIDKFICIWNISWVVQNLYNQLSIRIFLDFYDSEHQFR